MSLLTVKMMAGSPPPPVTKSIGSNNATSLKPSTLPFQVRIKEHQKLETSEKKSTNISRRDLALFLTAASVSAVTLSSPEPAAARISKIEMKKMILEKLKLLREKVGLSKPETTEENNDTASSSPPIADKEVSPPATSAPEEHHPVPPKPTLPNNIHNGKRTVVEAATLAPEDNSPEVPLPDIQNDKNTVVEAPTLP